uniref:HDC10624 n=1 Tax=Drosophila melanogaster TaxID=7227 RepID=Q6IL26_DROME|nr:TPA_inf: HDC10624 [Drosophila melanogaster]
MAEWEGIGKQNSGADSDSESHFGFRESQSAAGTEVLLPDGLKAAEITRSVAPFKRGQEKQRPAVDDATSSSSRWSTGVGQLQVDRCTDARSALEESLACVAHQEHFSTSPPHQLPSSQALELQSQVSPNSSGRQRKTEKNE